MLLPLTFTTPLPAKPHSGPCLHENITTPCLYTTKFHDKRADPTTRNTLLSLDFSQEPPTPNNIQKLASKHGFLTTPQPLKTTTKDGNFTDVHGEPLEIWEQTLPALHHAAMTWRMSMAKTWETWDSFFYEDGRKRPRTPETRPGTPKELQELTHGSRQLAQEIIEEKLRGTLSLRFPMDGSEGHLLQPPDLKTYLWLELGLAIASGGTPTHCPGCQGWFLVSGALGRTDKRYCSDACRMRVYRARKNSGQ